MFRPCSLQFILQNHEVVPQSRTFWWRSQYSGLGTLGHDLLQLRQRPRTEAPDKLILPTNYVSPYVIAHMKDRSTFDEAIKTLSSMHMKPVNEVFARIQHATRKELAFETIDQFLVLIVDSKHCRRLQAYCHFNMGSFVLKWSFHLKKSSSFASRLDYRKQSVTMTSIGASDKWRRFKLRKVIDYSTNINKYTLFDPYPMPRIYDLFPDVATSKVFNKLNFKRNVPYVPLKFEEKLFTAFDTDCQLFNFNRALFEVS